MKYKEQQHNDQKTQEVQGIQSTAAENGGAGLVWLGRAIQEELDTTGPEKISRDALQLWKQNKTKVIDKSGIIKIKNK